MRPWPRVNSKPRLTLPYCSLQGVITQPNHDVEYDERPPSRKVYEREAGSSGAGQSEAAAKSALSQTSRTEAVLPRNTDPKAAPWCPTTGASIRLDTKPGVVRGRLGMKIDMQTTRMEAALQRGQKLVDTSASGIRLA